MKRENVLKLCESQNEIERVNSLYDTCLRFKNVPVFDHLEDEEAAKNEIKRLVARYNSVVESRCKRAEIKLHRKKVLNELNDLLDKAEKVNLNDQVIINSVKDLIKDSYNKQILNEIEALKQKMLQ